MKRFMLLLLLLPALFLWGCSSSGDGDDGGTNVDPEDQAAADEAATDGMEDLMEDMEGLMGEEFDPEDVEALMDMDTEPYAAQFEAALELDPNCGPAHFGLAFVEMVDVAQNNGLEDIIGLLDGEETLGLPTGLPLGDNGPLALLADGLLGNSFRIMHRAPLAMVPQEIPLGGGGPDKDGVAVVRALQTHIHDELIPATTSIVNHLAAAENDPDFQILIVSEDVEPDTLEIDLGEVYILDAVVRAMRSGLYMATAYDVEPAPDGDYSWLVDNLEGGGYTSAEVHTNVVYGDTLYLYDDDEVRIMQQAEVLGGIEALLEPGTDFLALWTDPWSGENSMEAAHDDIMAMMGKLENAYTFIQAEGDDQDNDLISQILLAELDAGILEMGEELPDYMGTWETLPDLIGWIEDFLSGPFTFEVILEDESTFDLTVNISALFNDPVEDWKTKLPYMTFLDMEEYATYDDTYLYGPYSWNPANPYYAQVAGEDVQFNNIVSYRIIEIYWDTELPLVFLDGPDGDPLDGEFFYFPDYTFGGLFPDMDRADWLTLLGIGAEE